MTSLRSLVLALTATLAVACGGGGGGDGPPDDGGAPDARRDAGRDAGDAGPPPTEGFCAGPVVAATLTTTLPADALLRIDVDGDDRDELVVLSLGRAGGRVGAGEGRLLFFGERGEGYLAASPVEMAVFLENVPNGAVADFDSDGFEDLVLARLLDTNGDGVGEDRDVALLRGDGAGGLGAPAPLYDAFAQNPEIDPSFCISGCYLAPESLEAADLDRDGHADLAIRLGPAMLVAWGAGDGTFARTEVATEATFPVTDPADPDAGVPLDLAYSPNRLRDVDGDGDLDLLAHVPQLVSTAAWIQASPRVFLPATLGDLDSNAGAGPVADWDGDGKVDLLDRSDTTEPCHPARPGDGDGTFGAPGRVCRTVRGCALDEHLGLRRVLEIGDVDGDGAPEAVCADGASLEWVHARFCPGAAPAPVPIDSATVALGDFDGDGVLEVAVADAGATTIRIVELAP